MAAAAAQNVFPSRIDLPNGFRPEGIATQGTQFYVGSIPTGAVYRGNLRTGSGAVFVQPQSGRAAIGLKVDRKRIFVAGGPTGDAFVYDARTGGNVAAYDFASSATFVNDVAVTKSAAWFTDSMKPVLYRVPLGPGGRPGAASAATTVPLTGDYQHVDGEFNLNGIAATPNGKTLVVVQSTTGRLFTVTPSGVTRAITLAAGEGVPNGDGILLEGRTLYVAQNQLNLVAKISLSARSSFWARSRSDRQHGSPASGNPGHPNDAREAGKPALRSERAVHDAADPDDGVLGHEAREVAPAPTASPRTGGLAASPVRGPASGS